MESTNTLQSNERLSQILDQINETCSALISALDVNAQSVGDYAGTVVQKIDSEYVDKLIERLLMIKYHLLRLKKEINNGIIASNNDLQYIVSGLQDTIDLINQAKIDDGFLRNQFSFATDELQILAKEMIEEIEITY